MAINSYGALSTLNSGGTNYSFYRITGPGLSSNVEHLPYCMKVLLENLLRNEDGVSVTSQSIEAIANWAGEDLNREIAFSPARVLMQDFTGVPAVADLAAMRDAMVELGADPEKINPLIPAELVIDHSVVVDYFGDAQAFQRNAEIEFERNSERYRFLRWGQNTFRNFSVVPPGTGICHQVNLEYLSRVVFVDDKACAYPDTLVGTDSHTTMVNGIGVLGWGVGGIEAEAAMLGQPISMLIPPVVGLKLHGRLSEGVTATDLVLTIAQLLRNTGVVGKFVEVYGPGVAQVPAENRATIGNMSPEYGCTSTIFPIDAETIRYLKMTGRSTDQLRLVEHYAKEQGLWYESSTALDDSIVFSQTVELDLGSVEPSIAGPSRPQDRIPLTKSKQAFVESLSKVSNRKSTLQTNVKLASGDEISLEDGSVVIAAITSCTNTSNPSVMLAAGLLAKHAVEAGITTKPWVKTSLAPGSKAVSEYFERTGLSAYLDKLGFNLVGYGCTTCIGNSGPLEPSISQAINDNDLSVAAVLSGNRNFEGRINPDVRMNYLASPPLVVAYALCGTMNIDLYSEPLGTNSQGGKVFLKDIWPTQNDISKLIESSIDPEMFSNSYTQVFSGDEKWQNIPMPSGELYSWEESSTYVRRPPFFEGLSPSPKELVDLVGCRILAILGDSVTTDHISPAGSIKPGGPAGNWLEANQVARSDFNSYGSRRGNHEVMMRGTLANIRIRNQMVSGVEGGYSRYVDPSIGYTRESFNTLDVEPIYDCAEKYSKSSTPLVIVAGKEYGSGSSRDWAAKGVMLLGVKAVIAESFERIHRSNLVGMGIVPLQLGKGVTVSSLGLEGFESIDIRGLEGWMPGTSLQDRIKVIANGQEIPVIVRVDTPKEQEYLYHGGILQYVLRSLK